jgi:uncharacterized membrane protein
MFEEFLGLPLHPLAVHIAIVLVPSLTVVALAYALVPRWRAKVGWLAVLLAVVAPISAVVARMAGVAFQERRDLPLQGDLATHENYGTITMWVTIALGVVTLALVWSRRAGGGQSKGWTWLTAALTVLVVAGAVAATVYVVLAGDLGSRIVWEGSI